MDSRGYAGLCGGIDIRKTRCLRSPKLDSCGLCIQWRRLKVLNIPYYAQVDGWIVVVTSKESVHSSPADHGRVICHIILVSRWVVANDYAYLYKAAPEEIGGICAPGLSQCTHPGKFST